jgi:hypothetical protein
MYSARSAVLVHVDSKVPDPKYLVMLNELPQIRP